MKKGLPPLPMRVALQFCERKHQTGLTLVELMISITLGLIVLLAIGSIYLGSRQTYRMQEDNARIQEAGKYALEVIGRSIKQAGADAETTSPTIVVAAQCEPPNGAPNTCVVVDNNGVAPAATDTFRNQFYAGREEQDSGNWGTRNCIGQHILSGAVVTNIFDLAADAASTATGTGLRCSNGTPGAGNSQFLVSNIEDLQVLYGIDTTNDQAADQYVATPTNWRQVVAVRVCVLIQSANNGLTIGPQTYLNCGGALGTAIGAAALTTAVAGDLRLHRSFVGTFNLRNRISGGL